MILYYRQFRILFYFAIMSTKQVLWSNIVKKTTISTKKYVILDFLNFYHKFHNCRKTNSKEHIFVIEELLKNNYNIISVLKCPYHKQEYMLINDICREITECLSTKKELLKKIENNMIFIFAKYPDSYDPKNPEFVLKDQNYRQRDDRLCVKLSLLDNSKIVSRDNFTNWNEHKKSRVGGIVYKFGYNYICNHEYKNIDTNTNNIKCSILIRNNEQSLLNNLCFKNKDIIYFPSNDKKNEIQTLNRYYINRSRC